jgi:hypothetical protein
LVLVPFYDADNRASQHVSGTSAVQLRGVVVPLDIDNRDQPERIV